VTSGAEEPAERDGYPFRFRCRRSGNCCARPGGFVRVGPDDVKAIAGHLGLSEAGVRARFLAVSGDRLREGVGGRCVFLEDGVHAGCGIYPVRPGPCRTWPFWPGLLESSEARAEAERLCPGIEPRAPDVP
jgi:Fe-S-cluster containining protein